MIFRAGCDPGERGARVLRCQGRLHHVQPAPPPAPGRVRVRGDSAVQYCRSPGSARLASDTRTATGPCGCDVPPGPALPGAVRSSPLRLRSPDDAQINTRDKAGREPTRLADVRTPQFSDASHRTRIAEVSNSDPPLSVRPRSSTFQTSVFLNTPPPSHYYTHATSRLREATQTYTAHWYRLHQKLWAA